jgi:hypothetical protein
MLSCIVLSCPVCSINIGSVQLWLWLTVQNYCIIMCCLVLLTLLFSSLSLDFMYGILHCNDAIPNIRNKYSQKRNCTALVPYFHIHVYVSDLYIPGPICLFCCRKICGPILRIYKSLIVTRIWKLGLRRRNSFLGIHVHG